MKYISMLRRTRIKGIANIPVRRKADASVTVKTENVKEETPEALEEKTETIKNEVEVIENTPAGTQDSLEVTVLKSSVTDVENKQDLAPISDKVPEISELKNSEVKPLRRWLPKPSVRIPLSRRSKPEILVENYEIGAPKVPNSDINDTNKVPVSVPGINSVVESSEISGTNEVLSAPTDILSDNEVHEVPHVNKKIDENSVKIISVPNKVLSDNEVHKVPHVNKKIDENSVKKINVTNEILSDNEVHEVPHVKKIDENSVKKLHIISDLTIKTGVDIDRTLQCPLSPNKLLNRARIRPIPKLYRRNSVQGSASESEDDGRRSRIRNDSVCSTQSFSTDTVRDGQSIKDRLCIKERPQKLFRRSDQSRKVAEAKREFYQKFGAKIPDRKRLTMMDLIYYNPTTNPLPQRPVKPNPDEPAEIIIEICKPEVKAAEEPEDEPKEDEEDAIPVPQVKVGPNGEIILDEQSLVIEQTGTKKGRELLANSQIVNVDDLDRQYGIYKRVKRSKDWSIIETLRFYKTLNTVGTDFSLMLALFPGRSRRELKMKFKKEERVNRQLIDKAIMNPLEFDLTELEEQLVEEERMIAVVKEKPKKTKQNRRRKRSSKGSVLSSQLDEENIDDPADMPDPVPKRPKRERNTIKRDSYSILEQGLDNLIHSDSESDVVQPLKLRPPRSCMKIKKKYVEDYEESDQEDNPDRLNNNNEGKQMDALENREEISENGRIEQGIVLYSKEYDAEVQEIEDLQDEDPIAEESKTLIDIQNIIDDFKDNEDSQMSPDTNMPNDLAAVEPGSLMILSSLDSEGKQVFKVFMVAPGQTKVPVNLSPDVVQSLTSSLGNAHTINLDLPVIQEGKT